MHSTCVQYTEDVGSPNSQYLFQTLHHSVIQKVSNVALVDDTKSFKNLASLGDIKFKTLYTKVSNFNCITFYTSFSNLALLNDTNYALRSKIVGDY